MQTKEQFDSEKQNSLFNHEATTPTEGPALTQKLDAFMSGLSRAFTLTNQRHFTGGRQTLHKGCANETLITNFTNANGETFVVTVEKR